MLVRTTKGIRIATTSGVIRMAPGTERDLEGDYLQEALKRGAKPVKASQKSRKFAGARFELDQNVQVSEDEMTARDDSISWDERVKAAVKTLLERNDSSVLTSQGLPRVRDVASVLGEEVTREEIQAAVDGVS